MPPKNLLDDQPEVFVTTAALSAAISRGLGRGQLRSLGSRVYTKNLRDPPELLVRRHLWFLVDALVPGALVADRTALTSRPAEDGSIFIVADRKRDVVLPGLRIRPRPGPPPLPSDRPFLGGLFFASDARAFLDNMARSRRADDRARRTLTRAELEVELETRLRHGGEAALQRIREGARAIAPALGREAELAALEGLIGALLGTRDAPLLTELGRARRAGSPYDPQRLERFERLRQQLRVQAPGARRARALTTAGQRTLEFFEAYFSNYIEGTRFAVDKAAEIVFGGSIPSARPEDAHDVLGTWKIVADPLEMARTPARAEELFALLRARHQVLMSARPDKHPGEFKLEANQAGSTLFVAPELVLGTLARGLELHRSLEAPFARAVFMMFLITEVHPFTDGNGRIARVMMNADLVAAGATRIVIPTVFRSNYISALKALSHGDDASPLIRVLDFAQRWVDAIPWGDLEETRGVLAGCHAFLESDEADELGLRLTLPDPG